MRMNFNFKNDKGFSLIDVILGGAILAGLSLVAVKMFEGQQAVKREGLLRSEIESIHEVYVKTLSNELNCMTSLEKFKTSPPLYQTFTDYVSILDSNDTASELISQSPNSLGNDIYYCENLTEGTNECDSRYKQSLLKVGEKIPNNPNYTLVGAFFEVGENLFANKKVRSKIQMIYKLTERTSRGNKRYMIRPITFNTEFDHEGHLTRCLGSGSSMVSTLKSVLCERLGLVDVNCASILESFSNNCSSFQNSTGLRVRSDDPEKCGDPKMTTHPDDLISSSPANCAGKTTIKFQNSAGKALISCN